MSGLPARLQHVLQLTPVAAAATMPLTLAEHLRALLGVSMGAGAGASSEERPALYRLLLSLADATSEIARLLRNTPVQQAGADNIFGDHQLNVDVASHEAVLAALRLSGVCATASSEEDPQRIDLSDSLRPPANEGNHPHVFSVAFDPLDGSSIIGANFAVGSIFSVFQGKELLGHRVQDQSACAIAQYGPRTTIIFALPTNVFEVTFLEGRWMVTRPSIVIAPTTKTFAPANLRSAADDAAYRRLIDFYIANKYTLRYSGGLVPDFYHVLTASSGIFLSPVHSGSKAKLRLLYEVAALTMVSVWARGGAVDEHGQSLAERVITQYEMRSGLIIGSTKEVERYQQYRLQK